jgi:hypothetical protein
MNSLSRSSALIPYPAFPPSFAGQFPEAGIGMRRFGIYENDLEIDFVGSDTPALITRILEQCAIDPDGCLPAGVFRELSVGKRLECVLVLAAGGESSAFNFPFRCSGCGQELELELTLDEISGQQREADLIETVEVKIKGERTAFRKPNGRDQENWAGMVFRDEREAAGAMIGTLTVTPAEWETLDAEDLDRIDEAMDEADPLVNFLCHVACGECGEQNEFLIDLCDAALGTLSRLQKQLIVMVHKLASHYHWSEKEVFAIPHWRRIEYLNLIAAGR